MEWIAIIWSGIVATTAAAAFFWLCRSVGWTDFSPTLYLGCLLIPDPRRPQTDTLGFLLVFLLGSTVGPTLFRTVLGLSESVDWMSGLVMGGILGVAAAAAVPLYGMISACVRNGLIRPPRRFGIGWGRFTPAVIVAGCMIYGATFGAVYAGF